MNKILLALFIIFSNSAFADEPTPPPMEHCTLDDNRTDVYLCMQTNVGEDVYLAVFAKDGRSAIRISEIKKNGKQDVVFPPWTSCSFFKTCTIHKQQ